jgi:hypothetical protein
LPGGSDSDSESAAAMSSGSARLRQLRPPGRAANTVTDAGASSTTVTAPRRINSFTTRQFCDGTDGSGRRAGGRGNWGRLGDGAKIIGGCTQCVAMTHWHMALSPRSGVDALAAARPSLGLPADRPEADCSSPPLSPVQRAGRSLSNGQLPALLAIESYKVQDSERREKRL